jgi:hypothetical protein
MHEELTGEWLTIAKTGRFAEGACETIHGEIAAAIPMKPDRLSTRFEQRLIPSRHLHAACGLRAAEAVLELFLRIWAAVD